MARTTRTTLLALALCAGAFAFAEAAVVLPTGDDEYARLAARAQAEDQTVDFRALRFAYLQRDEHGLGWMDLQKQMYAAVEADDAAKARELAEKLISADYINMHGHKILRQACAILKDEACAKRHHFVQFGLLKSIVNTGDGKTCKTGWEVVTIGEEYFIIAMLGAQLQQQALVNGPPTCDQMTVTADDGTTKVLYFRVDAIFEARMRRR
jgi:hypothetical protein